MPNATSNQYRISSAVMIYLHYLFSSKNTKTGNLSPKYLLSVNVEFVFLFLPFLSKRCKGTKQICIGSCLSKFIERGLKSIMLLHQQRQSGASSGRSSSMRERRFILSGMSNRSWSSASMMALISRRLRACSMANRRFSLRCC